MEKEVLQKKVLWYVFISLCNFAYNPRLTEFLRKWNQTTIACISEIPNPSVFTPSFHPFPPIFLPLPHSDFFSTHFSISLRHPYLFLIHSSISLPHPYFFSIHPPSSLPTHFSFPLPYPTSFPPIFLHPLPSPISLSYCLCWLKVLLGGMAVERIVFGELCDLVLRRRNSLSPHDQLSVVVLSCLACNFALSLCSLSSDLRGVLSCNVVDCRSFTSMIFSFSVTIKGDN